MFKAIIDWFRGVEHDVYDVLDKLDAYVLTPGQALKRLEDLIERKTHFIETQEAILAEIRHLRDEAAEQIALAKKYIKDFNEGT